MQCNIHFKYLCFSFIFVLASIMNVGFSNVFVLSLLKLSILNIILFFFATRSYQFLSIICGQFILLRKVFIEILVICVLSNLLLSTLLKYWYEEKLSSISVNKLKDFLTDPVPTGLNYEIIKGKNH